MTLRISLVALLASALVACGGRPVPTSFDGSTGVEQDGEIGIITPDPDGQVPPDTVQVPDPDGPGAGPKCPGGWCMITAGTYKMGSPAWEPCREKGSAKESLHQVTLTRPFIISATEVTQGQFKTLMGYNPSSHKSCGERCPVEMVNWHEAAAYANHLSVKLGLATCYTCSGSGAGVSCTEATAYRGGKVYACPGYRLPTDAEWEYAYRAGTKTAFYSGGITWCLSSEPNAAKIGWYDLNSGSKTHVVGKRQPNAWGLYDMPGNVFEWIHDRFADDLGFSPRTDPAGPTSGDSRVLRGGSWFSFARVLRGAYRSHKSMTGRYYHLGFRIVRSLQK